ncbi:ATP-binding protein [Kiloniella sp.]|uniref:ATP-binding protein n=1 Tax=Kiloniella sp. TaxID=1938587 RepID=UPI003B0113A8
MTETTRLTWSSLPRRKYTWFRERLRTIGIRLFLAFGIVAGTTVLSAFIAGLAFERLSGDLSRLTNIQLPATSLAARIAEIGGDVRADMPSLLTAGSEKERLKIRQNIEEQISRLKALLDLNPDLIDSENRDEILTILPEISTSLRDVDNNVGQRFKLKSNNERLIERLRWAHADFLAEIDPIVEDASFNMASALDRLVQSNRSSDLNSELTAINDMTQMREAVMRVNAASNLAVGLIMRGATQGSLDDIEVTRQFLAEVADTLEVSIELIEADASSVSLRQAVNQILGYSRGENDVLALRKRELLFESKGRALLRENNDLFFKLEKVVSAQILAAEQRALEATLNAEKRISQERFILILSALVSVTIFIFVGWGYVGNRIVSRLSELRKNMAAIATGDLDVNVKVSGQDEISEMAEALLVFRNTAQEVENSNAKSIINNSLVGLVSTDAQGAIEFVNPSAESLFGVAQTDVAGALFVDTFLAEGQGESWRELLGNKANSLKEIKGRRRDGSEFFLDVAVRSYKLRRADKFLITLEDATERREARRLLEQRIQERTAELHKANELLTNEIQEKISAQEELLQAAKLAVLGQMSAGIAHESNQTLAAITYNAHNAKTLLQRGQTDEAHSFIEKIGRIAERMGKTVNHLKVFARRPSQNIEPVSVALCLDQALSLFEERIRGDRVDVVRGEIDAGLSVLAELVRLEQVIVNLISNALDAMKGQSAPRLELRVDKKASRCAIEIIDNGCGLDEELKGQIFDPFFTTKEVGEGLGLGLSITQKIVTDLGGVLEVDSKEGKGSCMRVVLNCTDQERVENDL